MKKNGNGEKLKRMGADPSALMEALEALLQRQQELREHFMAFDKTGNSHYGTIPKNSPEYRQFLLLDEQIAEIFQAFYSEPGLLFGGRTDERFVTTG